MTPSGGGAANFQGTDYQARVAAWLGARALAGAGASPMWGWPQDSQIRSVWVETDDEVDDIRVDCGPERVAFIQAKHRVVMSRADGSAFVSAIRQFVSQARSMRSDDRLVLATSSASSQPVLRTLPTILKRARQTDSVDAEHLCHSQVDLSVHSTLLGSIQRCWGARWGREATRREQVTLLKQMQLTVVDPYADESQSNETLQLLRARLLNAAQAESAFDALFRLASETAILRSRLTADFLAEQLQSRGIPTRTSPNFDADIRKLRRWSSNVLQSLRGFETIVGDQGQALHLHRDFIDELADLAGESCLITGEPGAGKSGSLPALAERLSSEADVVILAADALRGESLGQLRDEIGLENDLSDVLSEWKGETRGYLIVDALDAGRGAGNQRALLDLISTVLRSRGRWRVVATVRRFDLRYNSTLQSMFRTDAMSVGEHHLAEFANVRHFVVPALSEHELTQLAGTAPVLHGKIAAAPKAMRTLIGNYFCLWLYSELAHTTGTAVSSSTATRVGLLERYWSIRVLGGAASAAANETLIRNLCNSIVSAGALTIPWSAIVTPENEAAVDYLLRAGVIVEGRNPSNGARSIAFAHHVLFDYATSVVLLREGPTPLETLAASSRALLFVARPSFQLHFEYLWELSEGRAAFWNAAMSLSATANVPEIARVIAPSVAAEQIATEGDFAQLIGAIATNREPALAVLRHLVLARLSGDWGSAIPGERRAVWTRLLERLTPQIPNGAAMPLRALLREFLKPGSDEAPGTTAAVGSASRALLEWLWDQGITNRAWVYFAVKGVVAGVLTAQSESLEMLGRILEPEHLVERGYVDLPLLADEVPHLWGVDPVLVARVFATAFEFEETSQDATPITSGVLSLTSNRRQDYAMAHHTLRDHFLGFISAAPVQAIAALSAIGRKYSQRYGSQLHEFAVQWEGREVWVLEDHPFWATEHHGDEEADLLSSFESWLNHPDNGTVDRIVVALDEMVSLHAPAAMWRSLLRVSSSSTRLQLLLPLLSSPDAMLSTGLSHPIGEAIRLGFQMLDGHDRRAVESALERVADETSDERATATRDRLLACIPPTFLESELLSTRLGQLASEGSLPENRPPVLSIDHRAYDPDDHLRESGIDPDDTANAHLRALAMPVKAFASRFLNSKPPIDESSEAWIAIKRVWGELSDSGAAPLLIKWTKSDIVQALEGMARSDWPSTISPNDERLLVEIVDSLSHEDAPEPPSDLAAFDESPHFVSGPRPTSAQILLSLLQRGKAAGMRSRLLELARDPSVHVRLALVDRAHVLANVDRAAIDEIVAELTRTESSGAILANVIQLLCRVSEDDEELLSQVERIYDLAMHLRDRGKSARIAACQAAAGLYIWRGAQRGIEFVRARLSGADSPAFELGAFQGEFRSGFQSDQQDGDVRERSFLLANETLNVATARLRAALDEQHAMSESDRELNREELKGWASVIEGVGNDVYFASGAYERQGESPQRPKPSIDGYYELAHGLLRGLLVVPYASVVHLVIETLDYLSPADPPAVFVQIAESVVRGREGGYEYDPSGQSLLVKIVGRYLVHDRGLFQVNEACREALVDILDTLVLAGSTDATTLTYQLQEVFR